MRGFLFSVVSFAGGDARAVGLLDSIRSWFAPTVPALNFGARAASSDAELSLAEELARGIGGWSLPRRGSAELLAAYSTTPWLHATVRRRAEALSAVEWNLYRPASGGRGARLRGMRSAAPIRHRAIVDHEREKRLEQVMEHPLLDLLEHPSEGIPGPLYWELLSKWLDLLGEAPQAMTFDGDDVVDLTPIVPTWLTSVPSTERPWFEITTPRRSKPIVVPEEDMLWVRQHDPVDPWRGRGVGTAQVLSDELETDGYMAMTAKSRFYNRANPDWIIGLLPAGPAGTQASPEAVEKLEKQIKDKHGGPSRAGQFHIINRDVRAVPMSQSLVENQYIDGRKFLRDACMQVFGVPPEILGVLTNSNRSTIDAADYLFAKFSTLPQLERLRAFYQAQLVPLFGEELVLDFVSPVPDDIEFEKDLMVALPQAFDINEVRSLVRRAPKPDGARPYPSAAANVPAKGAPKKEPANAADP